MDPISFQNALRDLMPPDDLLDMLEEDWYDSVSEAIDEIAP